MAHQLSELDGVHIQFAVLTLLLVHPGNKRVGLVLVVHVLNVLNVLPQQIRSEPLREKRRRVVHFRLVPLVLVRYYLCCLHYLVVSRLLQGWVADLNFLFLPVI